MRKLLRGGLAAVAMAPALVIGAHLAAEESPALEYMGNYEWNEGSRGRIFVEFFPDGLGGWEVTFRFEHARRFQTWRGTALGDLGSGALEGTAQRGRYKFHGTFEDGVFSGRHFEVNRRGLKESGTLTFEADEKQSRGR